MRGGPLNINQTIRQRRIELGLTERDVADSCGITIDAYCDVELYADELNACLELKDVRRLSGVLELGLFALFGLDDAAAGTSNRNCVIAKQRLLLGMSVEQLAEQLGFEAHAVEEMERDPDFLESWSVKLVERLSAALKIPLEVLLSRS